MQLLAFAALLSALVSPLPASALDQDLYGEILIRHTRATDDLARTRVDYAGLRESADWKRLVTSLESTDPTQLTTRSERLAFWINAYNILAIETVVRSYPVQGIRDIGSLLRPVWKRTAGAIAGREYSLDQIEHGIVRPMGDPRTHAALVCASLSCPPLRREPWRAEQLDGQLDAAVRSWLADPRKGLRIDRTNRRVQLSAIFGWFSEDFEKDGGVLGFVTRYAPESEADWLRGNANGAEVTYMDYDWSLNDLATAPGSSAPARGAGSPRPT